MPSTHDQPQTTSPRQTFRAAYLEARDGAVERCRVEMREGDAIGNAAISRCIAAIEALDVRHAMNWRLRELCRAALDALTADIDPCLEKREPDEPMFILLARDSAAPATIERWCELRLMEIWTGARPDTPEEHEHIRSVRAKADQFRAWREANR